LTEQAIQAYQKVLDLNPATADYGNPVVEVARMALGNAYHQQGIIAYLQGDNSAALQSFEQSLAILEDVRGSFEVSVKEDESHRRYLTQVYEYLGETYQWQGLASEVASDYPAAIQSYQQSLASYQLCIAQAESAPDQIIQDIVEGYCQPRAAETQSLYDTLTGGQ
jgi:tetratricopeptide (TPR) repeat protein